MENSHESSEILQNSPEDYLAIDEEALEFLKELDDEKGAGFLLPIGVILAIVGLIFLLISLTFLMVLETTEYEDGYQDETVMVSPSSSKNIAKVSLVFIAIGSLFVFFDIGHDDKIKTNLENNFE